MDSKRDDSDDPLVRAVFDYFYESEALESRLRKFCIANLDSFVEARPCEYTLEQTRLDAEFQDFFESQVEAFMGASLSDFYRAVIHDPRTTELYSGHTIAAVINMTMKFENFYDFMRDANDTGE